MEEKKYKEKIAGFNQEINDLEKKIKKLCKQQGKLIEKRDNLMYSYALKDTPFKIGTVFRMTPYSIWESGYFKVTSAKLWPQNKVFIVIRQCNEKGEVSPTTLFDGYLWENGQLRDAAYTESVGPSSYDIEIIKKNI